jgi:DNA-binding transcriptional ArsR family regulator
MIVVQWPGATVPTQADDEIELAAVLHALSDPVRLKIVAALANSEGEPTCGSFDVPVTKSTCTHHFKVLREAGIIQQRQQGTTRLNTLRRDDLEERFPGLLATILRASSELEALESHQG